MIVCPVCQTPNPATANFCMNCGTRLRTTDPELPQQPPASPARQLLPQELAAKLERARQNRAMQGERRVVTMLFCDVVDSTALAAQFDPETWAELMNEAFERLIAPIYRYEGTVARLMGDGLLAFFGAPIAHEDDPQRAVLAGLDIIRGIRPLAQRVSQVHGLDFDVRIGISTGPVVVGEIGSDLALEYTAMGDAINMAARMEETGQPGTVQISDQTQRLVEHLFELESLGLIQVKGKAEPVRAFKVLEPKADPRVPAINYRPDVPVIGRIPELNTLDQAMADLLQGRGQIVSLVGDAGLGKSRLLTDVRARWQQRAPGELQWVAGRGISYDSTRPYGVFQQYLRQFSQVTEHDSPRVVRRKVRQHADFFPPRSRATMIRVSEMLLAAEIDPSPKGSQGEGLQREIMQAFLATGREAATRQPLVIEFDDMQWADAASVDLLLHLFQLVYEVPVLFLCACRPYAQSPGWRAHAIVRERFPDRYQELSLQPLSPTESNLLVNHLLGDRELPAAVRQMALAKAEGNPLFVEEVIQSLIDAGMVTSQARYEERVAQTQDPSNLSIPDSIQALLTARIDRLQPSSRHLLQLASIIGRTFDQQVLAAIYENAYPNTSLTQELADLLHSGLILADSPEENGVYSFRHDLTREAAYGSILHRRRRQLHQEVGEAIERLYPGRIEQEAHRLAQHFAEAGDAERAQAYYIQAGDEASRLYANAEAVEHYARALEFLGQSSEPDKTQLLHVYSRRGRALELNGRYAEALANYKAMEQAARRSKDPRLELAALTARSVLYSTPTQVLDIDQGRKVANRALTLARQLHDQEAEATLLWNLSLASSFGGDTIGALFYGEKALTIARQESLQELEAYALNDLALNGYIDTGQLARAIDAFQEAETYWKKLDNQPMLADNLSGQAIARFLMGDLEGAQQTGQRAQRISEAIDNLWGQSYSRWAQGDVYFEQGLISEAIEVMREGASLGKQAGFIAAIVNSQLSLARVYGYLGLIAASVELIDRTRQHARPDLLIFSLWPDAVQARLHLGIGDPEAAEACLTQQKIEDFSRFFQQGFPQVTVEVGLAHAEWSLANKQSRRALDILDDLLSYLTEASMRVYQSDALRARSHALQQLGETEEALATLEQARSVAEDLGSRRLLWLILVDMANLTPQPAEAQKLQRQAQEIVRVIADHTGSEELRAAFLSRADVRRLL